MVPQIENVENISVNIYETGSFTKFDERDPDINFFDDITKSIFETSYFEPNEIKSYPLDVHSIWKNVMSYMSIFEVLNVILKT